MSVVRRKMVSDGVNMGNHKFRTFTKGWGKAGIFLSKKVLLISNFFTNYVKRTRKVGKNVILGYSNFD